MNRLYTCELCVNSLRVRAAFGCVNDKKFYGLIVPKKLKLLCS